MLLGGRDIMSDLVKVALGDRSYPIHIGSGVLRSADLAFLAGADVLLVADATVDALHGDMVAARLAAAGARVQRAVVPVGEASKAMSCAAGLCEQAAAGNLDRSACVVALGGGMTGDLAGFVAAIYLRGVRFVQVPTTLLAMVDSSVGGKTGVNLPQGKNLVGVFHQPCAVLADLDLLDTLPEREYLSGFAEVVKYGVICDAVFLDRLAHDAAGLRRRDKALLQSVVARCCAFKAGVVGADEREHGRRAILNFGHTLAHALENVEGYGRRFHGEAVAIGMAFALDLSVRRLGLAAADAMRVKTLLRAFGLPDCADEKAGRAAWPSIRRAMNTDKKNAGRKPRFVLAEALGRVRIGCEVPDDVLEEVWNVSR